MMREVHPLKDKKLHEVFPIMAYWQKKDHDHEHHAEEGHGHGHAHGHDKKKSPKKMTAAEMQLRVSQELMKRFK